MSTGKKPILQNRWTMSSDYHWPKFEKIRSAVHDAQVVSGSTHGFYRYPARFSPTFVRTVIEELTNPGDTILDPFLGGGTTLVEGLSLNRRVIGVDLNPISIFVSTVKSTPLLDHQIKLAAEIASRCVSKNMAIRDHAASSKDDSRFLNTPWWLRGVITSVQAEIERVGDRKVGAFLRCALLRTSQWSLDCRAQVPDSGAFVAAFQRNVHLMSGEMSLYSQNFFRGGKCGVSAVSKARCLLQRSTIGLHEDPRIPREWLPVKLVLTSPPYPGVHILYHRWQVRGRRETPAAYAVIGSPDGHAPSYFTLGGRHRAGLDRYFAALRDCFSSVVQLMDKHALLIQLVSVTKEKPLMARLKSSIEQAGLEGCELDGASRDSLSGLWRTVPNRKWYAAGQSQSSSGRELLLVHQRSSKPVVL